MRVSAPPKSEIVRRSFPRRRRALLAAETCSAVQKKSGRLIGEDGGADCRPALEKYMVPMRDRLGGLFGSPGGGVGHRPEHGRHLASSAPAGAPATDRQAQREPSLAALAAARRPGGQRGRGFGRLGAGGALTAGTPNIAAAPSGLACLSASLGSSAIDLPAMSADTSAAAGWMASASTAGGPLHTLPAEVAAVRSGYRRSRSPAVVADAAGGRRPEA